ncbi:NAD(P)-binding protein, partial [Aureobasidium melanogenum]
MSWSTPNNYKSRPVAVLGGGVLGRRIAACWVSAGWHVRVRDPSEKSRNDAVSYVEDNIGTYLALTNGEKGSVVAVADLEAAVKDAWLVFEAVPEILSLKEDTFAELEKLAPSDCILASNSSSYKCSELLAKVYHSTKERVLNTHYMMPPQALIVELMTSGHTNSEIFPLLEKELTKAGLHPYTAKKESTGFIFNRIWAAIKREVLAVIEEGVADPKTIDDIWKEQYSSPVGPCAMMDSVGLDTVHHIESHYVHDRGLPDNILDWLQRNYLDQGKLGNKCDKGGLYLPHAESHGTKLAVLNMNFGAYPGEISRDKIVSSGQILMVPVGQPAAKPITIVNDQVLPDGIDVHGNRIYWTCMGNPGHNDGAVYSARLDGSDVQTVIPAGQVHTPKQLHIDQASQKLYFCDREGLRIHRSNLDGTEHEVILQTGDWKTEKIAEQSSWPVGVTVSTKLNRVFWTQKGSPKSNQGCIFSAGLESPADPSAREDIQVVLQNLPEPIDLDFDDENGVLYWTDRGELPLGNTLNKKTLTGPVPAAEKALGRQVIAQGFGEAIGLRLDKEKQCIYIADLAGRLWQCGTSPGPKTKIHEAAGHAYTGITIVKF